MYEVKKKEAAAFSENVFNLISVLYLPSPWVVFNPEFLEFVVHSLIKTPTVILNTTISKSESPILCNLSKIKAR